MFWDFFFEKLEKIEDGFYNLFDRDDYSYMCESYDGFYCETSKERKKREKRERKEERRREKLELKEQRRIESEQRENAVRRHELELREQETAQQRYIAEQKRQDNICQQQEYARKQEARLDDERRREAADEAKRRDRESLFRLVSELKAGVAKVKDAIDSGNDKIGNAVIMSLIDEPIDRISRFSDKAIVAEYRDVFRKQQRLLKLCADGIGQNPPLRQRICDCVSALDAVVG